MPDSHQRKRKREYDAEIVICRHCGTPRTRRDERRHLRQQRMMEGREQDAAHNDVNLESNDSAQAPPEPMPNPLDAHFPTRNDSTRRTVDYVTDQIVHPELQIRRQRRLEPDDFEDDWYTQDEPSVTEETNLFGRIDPNRIDWDLLPENEPLDSPFAGLSAEEILGLDFEREMAQIDSSALSEHDFYILNSFNYRVTHNTSNRAFEDLRYAFTGRLDDLPTIYETQARVAALSGIKPMRIDCCRNSCICYTDMYASLQSCPSCHAPRFYSNGKPAKQFMYLPLIPRLIAMLNGPDREEMLYRHEHDEKYQPGQYTDLFGGSHYQKLKQHNIPTSRLPRRKYFSKETDIALGMASDGFCPFKNRKQSCWPICVFNFNLSPEIRFRLENTLCVGVIPGPSAVKDINSFLFPLVKELLDLIHGIPYYDKASDNMEVLHAFLVSVFGDMPAIAKIMEMKGHNGKSPCRACQIIAVRIPFTNNPAHYVPLRCPWFVSHDRPAYDPLNLPLRTHDQLMTQANEVINARTKTEEDRLSTKYGIKRIPLLSVLPTVEFPTSFPFDFMHLIWENLIPNLLKLWTGDFKGLNQGSGLYELEKTVYAAVCEGITVSGDSMPSSFGCRVPDPAKDRSHFTAESWSQWALYLGPILLRGRFQRPAYYTHFVELVRLLNICLQYELSSNDIHNLRVGFAKWVTKYEELYFQFKAERLGVCTNTVHALLHIADGVEAMGPVWCYWAYPMERFCGSLLPAIRSRRHPFASIDRRVCDLAMLYHIQQLYQIDLDLSSRRRRLASSRRDHFAEYKHAELISRQPDLPLTGDLYNKTMVCLNTRLGTHSDTLGQYIPHSVRQWGKVLRLGGGDLMVARDAIPLHNGYRDNSFIRYELLVDILAHRRNADSHFEPRMFYGQIRRIFLIELPAKDELGTTNAESIILVAVQQCELIHVDGSLGTPYYKDMGPLEVIDLKSVQCAVGRVRDQRGVWGILDRSGPLARAQFVDDEHEDVN